MKQPKAYKLEMTPTEFIIEREVIKILNMPSKKATAHLNKLAKKFKSGKAKFFDVAVMAKIGNLINTKSK